MYQIWCQSVQSFDSFPRLLNLWLSKTPRNAPWVTVEQIVVSRCPFSDESADVYQMWCQSVQSVESFPRLSNLWPPKSSRNYPWFIYGRLVFSLCPFPDESADVNQSWCQSVKPYDSFPRLLNLWHPKPPPMCPLVSRGAICLAYIHSQMNLHMWAKCGANRSSRLTVPPDFWICDPLNPPKCPLWYWGATWI